MDGALDGVFTQVSDVYSYGMLLWEIVTVGAATPLAGAARTHDELCAKIKAGLRPAQPSNCPDDVYQLMTECWDGEAELRPHIGREARPPPVEDDGAGRGRRAGGAAPCPPADLCDGDGAAAAQCC